MDFEGGGKKKKKDYKALQSKVILYITINRHMASL